MWNEGGLNITTTMVTKNETSADAAISSRVYSTDKVASALVEATPGTGAIVAMAQSKPMGSGSGQTYINLSSDPEHNGTSGFQAGSSFKIFVGLAALEQGISPSTDIDALHKIDDSSVNFAACPNGVNTTVPWHTRATLRAVQRRQHERPRGHDLRLRAVGEHVLPAARGEDRPVPAGDDRRVDGRDPGQRLRQRRALQQIPSFTLGTNNITPVEMAEAYATLASGGTYCTPYVITGVTDSSGKQYPAQTKKCAQVLDTNTVNELTYLLQQVVKWGTAAGAVPLDGREVAGKTGTTDSGVATWFDGFTPQLAAAVWTGFINWNTSTSMSDIEIGPRFYSGQVAGATISAPIFNQAMTAALQGVPKDTFTPPDRLRQQRRLAEPGHPDDPPGGAHRGPRPAGPPEPRRGDDRRQRKNGNGGFFGGIF
jgi:membrane peptidoglycan carboxypeptidase